MSPADAVTAAEIETRFEHLSSAPALILAVSGGPDSTALLVLAARWSAARKAGPKLVAVTVDHGLRPEAKSEASAVGRLARSLGVTHRTLRWIGPKPRTGLQQAARLARYRLLAQAARQAGARHVLTAHTLDDQAETVLIRLVRGSGVSGLAAMAASGPLPVEEGRGLMLVRPLLNIPKARLIATLKAANTPYAEDPSNRDPRFTRPRFRALMPALAPEGLSAERLALLARRVARSEAALLSAVDEAARTLAPGAWENGGVVTIEADAFFKLPEEIALRLLGRAVDRAGNEGPVELAKLEALHGALLFARQQVGEAAKFRRTLAGAVVTLTPGRIRVERAPRRRSAPRNGL